MAVEAPTFSEPTIVEGIYTYAGHNYPRYVNIPDYLIDATDTLGVKRANFLEFRVRNILRGETDIIENVVRNEGNSEEDSLDHDLTVTLREGFPIRVVHVQVKADRGQIVAYKQEIRDKYFKGMENSEELVRNWLTEHGIILLNGTDCKPKSEILKSFYPQLEEIIDRAQALEKGIVECFGAYHALLVTREPIQVFSAPVAT
jgi:hypothetical protein